MDDEEATESDESSEEEAGDPDLSVEAKCKLLRKEMGEELSESEDEKEPKRAKLSKKSHDRSTARKPSQPTKLGSRNGASELSLKIREALSGLKSTSKDLTEKDVAQNVQNDASDQEDDVSVDGESDDSDDSASNWKKNLAEKASQSFYERQVGFWIKKLPAASNCFMS